MHDQDNPYDYFVSKPVTVVTIASSLAPTSSNHLNYSVGVLKSVDEWTCVLQHPITKCYSIFRLNHVIAIHEEQAFDPESEEGKRILEEQEINREKFKNNNPELFPKQQASQAPRVERSTPSIIPAAKVKEQTSGFVSADDLEQLAATAAAKKKRPS